MEPCGKRDDILVGAENRLAGLRCIHKKAELMKWPRRDAAPLHREPRISGVSERTGNELDAPEASVGRPPLLFNLPGKDW